MLKYQPNVGELEGEKQNRRLLFCCESLLLLLLGVGCNMLLLKQNSIMTHAPASARHIRRAPVPGVGYEPEPDSLQSSVFKETFQR